MRLLYSRPDHECHRPASGRPGRRRSGTRARRHERESVPLWRLSRHHRGRAGRAAETCRARPQGGRMNTFDYVRPATIRDAVAAASEPGAAYLAGGTNVLDLMKGGVSRPNRLVDISHLPDL